MPIYRSTSWPGVARPALSVSDVELLRTRLLSSALIYRAAFYLWSSGWFALWVQKIPLSDSPQVLCARCLAQCSLKKNRLGGALQRRSNSPPRHFRLRSRNWLERGERDSKRIAPQPVLLFHSSSYFESALSFRFFFFPTAPDFPGARTPPNPCFLEG